MPKTAPITAAQAKHQLALLEACRAAAPGAIGEELARHVLAAEAQLREVIAAAQVGPVPSESLWLRGFAPSSP